MMNDTELKNLVEANRAYVVRQAHRRCRPGNPAFRDDLVQEGMLALVKAAKSFDPSKGNTFLTFAAKAVKGAMTKHILEQSKIYKIATSPENKKIYFSLRKNSDVEEVKKELEGDARITADKIESMKQRIDGGTVEFDIVHEPATQDEAYHATLMAEVLEAIGTLPEQEQYILRSKYLEGEKTNLELAEEFGVSEETIRRTLARAIALVQGHLNLKEGYVEDN